MFTIYLHYVYIHKFSSIYKLLSLMSSTSTDNDDDVVHTRKAKKINFENPLMIIMITAFFIPFHNYLHIYLYGIFLLLYKDTCDE